MLRISGLSARAGDFRLKDVSLEIEAGGYHALVGPSGSGKTLLLNVIAGFQPVLEGRVLLNGEDILTRPPEKRRIAYLFQDLALFPHMNVAGNIAYPLRSQKMKPDEIRKRVDEYLSFTLIEHLRDRSIQKLSGGEKQRVALARILAMQSQLILLDEPFAAIDTQLQPDLLRLLRKISSTGVTVLHVSHHYDEIIGLAKTISVIHEGSVVRTGKTADVLMNPGNAFMAGFGGIRNYFVIKKMVADGPHRLAVLENGIELPVGDAGSNEYHALVIDPGAIEISAQPAQGFHAATLSAAFRTRSGYHLELNAGMMITASVEGYAEAPFHDGQLLYIRIPAEAIRVL